MQANRQMPKILAFFILVVLCFQFSVCKISHFSAIYHRFGQKNGATLTASVAPPINLLKP
jgi:hypothetical protein